MKVIISAGGTGGHIYPALAIINEIKKQEPDSEFIYIGTHNRMEKNIIPKYNIPFESIEIYGFNKRKILRNFKMIKYLINAYKKCKKIIKDFHPDIVIGAGGYVTVPVILAANKLKVKTLIHEQNSIPGKSNLFLSSRVNKIATSFKSSINCFSTNNVVFTGNPCSDNAINIRAIEKETLGLTKSKKLIVIVMGSLGSSKINDYLEEIIPLFKNKEYEVLFITGCDFYDDINIKACPKNVKIVPYVDNLPGILKKTDVIVSRAGASTISEIISLSIPSILIPSPYVANNHQYKNAMDLVNKDAALMIEEKNLKDDILIDTIDSLLYDDKKCNKIKKNIKSLMVVNSSNKIYREIKKIVNGEE